MTQKVKHISLTGRRLNDDQECAGAAKTAALKRRTFTREFKLQVIREVEAGKTQAQVARDYQLSNNTISKWRRELRKYKERAFAGGGHAYTTSACQ